MTSAPARATRSAYAQLDPFSSGRVAFTATALRFGRRTIARRSSGAPSRCDRASANRAEAFRSAQSRSLPTKKLRGALSHTPKWESPVEQPPRGERSTETNYFFFAAFFFVAFFAGAFFFAFFFAAITHLPKRVGVGPHHPSMSADVLPTRATRQERICMAAGGGSHHLIYHGFRA